MTCSWKTSTALSTKQSRRIQRDRWGMRTTLYVEAGENTFQGRIANGKTEKNGK